MPYPEALAAHFLGVGGVIHHKNKILFVKLKYGASKKFWLIPGGLVERGETLEEGVIREIKEETNLDVLPMGIIGIRSMVRDGLTDVYTIFDCKLMGSAEHLKIQESEIAEAQWINVNEIPTTKGMISYTKTIVDIWRQRKNMQRDKHFDEQAKEQLQVRTYEQYWV